MSRNATAGSSVVNGGDDGDCHSIPPVVQRALGMHNIKNHQHNRPDGSCTHAEKQDGVIYGLEGFILSRYLNLRSGRINNQVNNGDNSKVGAPPFPEAWIRAVEEEKMNRHCNKQTTNGPSGSKINATASKRTRKRKRKSDHRTAADDCQSAGDQVMETTSNSSDGKEHADASSRKHTRRKRKRRRRGKGNVDSAKDKATLNSRNNSYHSSSCNNSNKDWIHYQMLARIIVAPYTPSLIATMNKCKEIEEQGVEKSGLMSDGEHISATRQSAPPIPTSDTGDSTTDHDNMQSSTARRRMFENIYQKKKDNNSHPPKNGNLLILSSPQEPLESIVDGAVCTLVRRKYQYRTSSNTSASSKRRRATGGRNDMKQIVYRRRQRRKANSHSSSNPANSTPNTTSLETKKDATASSSANNWLLDQNLLSTGYSLGNGDMLSMTSASHNSMSNSKSNNNKQYVRGCPNMAPGIHCIHPNTLTSYARSSPVMRLLHGVIGDDALRELLVNNVMLLPAVSTETLDSESSTVFARGNYFQLCGPPVNMLAKKFDSIGGLLANSNPCTKGNRKRKREDMDDEEESRKTKLPAKGVDTADERRIRHEDKANTPHKARWDPNRPIPRGNLFYCDFYNKHVGLSPRHLLNQSEEGEATTNNPNVNVKLLNAMVQLWPSSRDKLKDGSSGHIVNSNKRRGRWRRLRDNGIAMCQEMRKRHQQCDYSRLLEHHCPLPADGATASPAKDVKAALSHHVVLYTSFDKVGSFLEAVLRGAFPSSFWGSAHNFHQVVRTVKVFIKLGRTEQLPEKAIVEGIHVLDMKWLLPNSQRVASKHFRKRPKLSRPDHESTTELVGNVMRWLYRKYIIPLLRSIFYITETEFTGSRVLYYRRPVWTRIKCLSMKLLLKQQYREMSFVKAQKLLANHNVGCPPTPLRLLPKKTGIRAIAMLSKSCVLNDNASESSASLMKPHQPPNKILQSTFHALKYEHEKKPSLFGAGVLGLTEVFTSFSQFVEGLKQKQSNAGTRLPLYFASADIKHCYDTINQKRLYKLLRSVIEEDVYMTKNNFILHSKDSNSSLRCRWKKSTFSLGQFSRFLANSNDCVDKHFRSVFVDGVHCSMERKERIAGILRDHIFGQLVVANGSHGQRYLLQKDGIPQGSILSSMFCNIYFGNIEQFMLEDVFEKESSCIIKGKSDMDFDAIVIKDKSDLHLLVRIVDDFLLVSTCKDTSVRFLRKLNKGIPSLGVTINSDKSRVNYPISLRNTSTGMLEEVRNCHDYFPWCGLLIDTTTCEISLDYSRFCDSQATDTVTIHRTGSEGVHLKKKMKDFVRPRCNQKLLFSSCINGIDMILLNFYQTFVLCAMKTVHYLSGMGPACLKREKHIYDLACDTIHFAFLLISSKIKRSGEGGDRNGTTHFQLKWEDALWLGKRAFFSVFQRLGKRFVKLCKQFAEQSRLSNKKELLDATRRAEKMFPLQRSCLES